MISIETIFYNYCLTRPDKCDPFHPELDQPFWFGKGSNGRIDVHRREAKKCLKNLSLPRSYKINIILKLWEQGLDFTEEKICMNIPEQRTFEIEMEAIAKYGRKNSGTGCLANQSKGGEGPAGFTHSEESKQKMRGPRPSIAGENNPWWGIPVSEERKEPIRRANTGREPPNKGVPMPEAQKKKLSDSMIGTEPWNKDVPWPEEVKQKMRGPRPSVAGENNPMYGVPLPNKGKKDSEETKRKKSEARKRYFQRMREQKLSEQITSQEEDK